MFFAKQFTAVAALAVCLGVYSCKKDDSGNQTPTNPQVNTVIDATKLQAKWEVISNYQLKYDASGTVTSADGASQTYNQHGITPLPPGIPATYITFNPDNSYDLTDGNGAAGGRLLDYLLPNHGQWLLKNSNNTLNFEIKPAAGQSSIDYQSVEFKDSYCHLTYTDSGSVSKTVFHLEFKR